MNISHFPLTITEYQVTSSNKWTSPIFLLHLPNVSQQVLTNEQLTPTFLPYISQRVLTNEHLTFSFTKRQLASSNKWTSCIFLLLLPCVKWQVLTNERLATTPLSDTKWQVPTNEQPAIICLFSHKCHPLSSGQEVSLNSFLSLYNYQYDSRW